MKNHWCIKNLPRLAAIKRDHDATRRQIARLQKVANRLAEQVRVLDPITEIFEGTALCVHVHDNPRGHRYHITGVADDRQRWASVYPNAHNQGATYGVAINGWKDDLSDHLYYGDRWLGVDHTREQAILLAKTWVAKGTHPKQGEDT